jgi:hypothetical protein
MPHLTGTAYVVEDDGTTLPLLQVSKYPSVRTIDLGMVSLRDAAIYGRTRPLIPYADGRLIKSVNFVLGGTPSIYPIVFTTPVLGLEAFNNISMASLPAGTFNLALDSLGTRNDTAMGLDGYQNSNKNQILDVGPLVPIFTSLVFTGALEPWQANHPYVVYDAILDGNDHIQQVNINGVSGATLPTFNTSGGTTNDGTMQWIDFGPLPTGEVHMIAEVIEGVSPMPAYPASIEWLVQPAGAAAGEPMPDFSVIIKDQHGNPFFMASSEPAFSVFLVGAGTQSTGDNNWGGDGIETFSGYSIAEAGTYVFVVRQDPAITSNPIFSNPFVIT